MAKTPPPKRPPKKAKDERSQKQRFIDTAKSLDSDESGKAFERAMDRITAKRPSR